MKEITVNINGSQVKGKEGDTILDICQANSIEIPTLCHFQGLEDVGACRLCVVEVEKERKPVPACTYPARDGIVVKTHTEEIEKFRRLMLELIFTERNHFCMFCEKSGDCELQQLAYKYQMDNVRFHYMTPSLPLDALSEGVVIDHNRCVLCGRCVRACSEIVGVHTLDFAKRGYKTVVSPDLEQPLNESSCISCGTCVQVCPTGAIFSKMSMYKGKISDCQHVTTTCPVCGVGCQLDVLVKDNNVVRIDAPSINSPKGTLCQHGRFGLLKDDRPRVTTAMVRNGHGDLEESSLDRALKKAASGLKSARGNFAALASATYPEEALAVFNQFISEHLGSDQIDTLDGDDYRLISKGIEQFHGKNGFGVECSLEELPNAGCIILAGADPTRTHPVVSSLIFRAVHKGAKLIVIDPARDVMPLWSSLWLRPASGSEGMLIGGIAGAIINKGFVKGSKTARVKTYSVTEASTITGIESDDIEQAAVMYAKAESGVIIYGTALLERNNSSLVGALMGLAELTGNKAGEKFRVISLKPKANSLGAWKIGMAGKDVRRSKPRAAYLLLGEDKVDEDLLNWLKDIDFVVVQASRHSPATALAHVILPSPVWSEREGQYTGMDGQLNQVKKVVKPADGLLQDSEILDMLGKTMKQKAGG